MREKLGKRIYAIPFVAVILVSCIFGLAFSPILNATPHNLPLGIAIGVAVGAGIDSSRSSKRKKDKEDEEDEDL